jgi:hypothetical protein
VSAGAIELTGRPLLEIQREVVERLAPIDRTPCSPGEREAAEWLAQRLRAIDGVEVELEDEPSWGTFPPTGVVLGLLGLLAAAVCARGRPLRGALIAAASVAGIVDEAQNGPRVARRLIRRRRTTVNLIARIGERAHDDNAALADGGLVRQNGSERRDESGERTLRAIVDSGTAEAAFQRTLVVLAHHDAPQTGLIFDQTLQKKVFERAPRLIEGTKTPFPNWWLGLSGPLCTIVAALTRTRVPVRAALGLGAIATALVADVARSDTVPGANDNLSGVAALVGLAELLRERPIPGLRVLLVSCGAEETLQDGIRAFMASHRDELDPLTTCFVNLDTVGSPHLIMLEAEGPVWMESYTGPWLRDATSEHAQRLGIELDRGYRARASTDSVIPSRAGYPIVTLVSMTDWRAPANYHLPSDTPANLDHGTVADATRLTFALAESFATGAVHA